MNINKIPINQIDLDEERVFIQQQLDEITRLIERVSKQEHLLLGRLMDLKSRGLSLQMFEDLLGD